MFIIFRALALVLPIIYNNSVYLQLKTNFELNCFRLEDPFNYVYIDNDKHIQFFYNEKLKQWTMKDYGIVIEDPDDEKINIFISFLLFIDAFPDHIFAES